MSQGELLRLLSLVLLLAVVVVVRWLPGISHRKFDWRLFRSRQKRKK